MIIHFIGQPGAGKSTLAAEVAKIVPNPMIINGDEIWLEIYKGNPLVKINIIPDIASVNYGRGVGYEVKEIQVDSNTASISATEIRRQILAGENDWKELVDSRGHDSLEKLIKNRA
jgi:dephospho-CoA kinase